MEKYALELNRVVKQYKDFKLDNISFTVPRGSIVGLIGENGAGKTTILKAILNLISIDSGKIKIFGNENLDNSSIKEKIGIVFDENCFHENLSPLKIEKIMKQLYKQWNTELFKNYCTRFNIPIQNKISTFSKGMKMKFAITVALSHQPELLILDEATSGLDPVMRDEILDVFMDFIQNENHSILISSHIISDLEKIADYITFIRQGKVIFNCEKDTLIDEYGVVICGAVGFDKIDKSLMIAYCKEDYQYRILVKDRNTISKKFPNLIIEPASIEEIMLLYAKGEAL